jgi:hypothetical protein
MLTAVITYTCGNCKSSFVPDRLRGSRIPKFCSRKCSNNFVTDETREKQSAKKQGRTPWNKGVAMWAGREHPRGTAGRKFPDRQGANCHFWRGGKTGEIMAARKSLEYRQWRTAVFRRDDFTCQHCGKRGGKLVADHIKPFAYFVALRFEVDNGQTLCEPCHYQTDTYGSKALKYGGDRLQKAEST